MDDHRRRRQLYRLERQVLLTGCIHGGDEFVGDDDRATIYGQNSQLLLYGNHEVIHCGDGTSMAIMSGTGDRFVGAGFTSYSYNAATDPLVWIGGNGLNGACDTLTGAGTHGRHRRRLDICMKGEDDMITDTRGFARVFRRRGTARPYGSRTTTSPSPARATTSAHDVILGADCSITIATAANVKLATSARR